MKGKKNQKSSKKKGKKQEKLQILSHEPIVIGPGCLAETISKQIIDKLIVSTIIDSNLNRLYNHDFNNLCVDFMINSITPLIDITTMKYDCDSESDFERDTCRVNEPTKCNLERSAYSLLHINKSQVQEMDTGLKNLETKQSLKKRRSTMKLQEEKVHEEKEKESIESDDNNKSNKKNKSVEKKKKAKSVSSQPHVQPKIEKEKTNKENNQNDDPLVETKVRKPFLIDLPSYAIDIKDDRKESEMIKQIRIDYEKELIKRAEKAANINKRQSVKTTSLPSRSKLPSSNVNVMDMSKYTIDCDGKIIYYKQFSPESFSREFNEIKTKDKLIKQCKQERQKLSTPVVEREEKPKEPKSFFPNLISKFPNISNKYNLLDGIKLLNLKKEEKKSLCQPSGDNFDSIIPEPGDRIQNLNDSRFKQGDMNFFEKFNKYSSFDFSKTLKETNTKNNQTYLYSKNQDVSMISDLVSDSSQNVNMKNLSSFASGKNNSSRNEFCLSKMLGNNSLTMSSNLHNMSYTLHKSFSSSKLTVKSPTCLAQTFYDDVLSSTNNEELLTGKRKQLVKFAKIFKEMPFKKLNMAKLNDDRRNRSTGLLDKFTKKLVFSSYDDLNTGNKRLLNDMKEEGDTKIPIKYDYEKLIMRNGLIMKPPLKAVRIKMKKK